MRPPNPFPRANLYLALGCIAFALLLALVWAPMDSGTGLIAQVRRRVIIGDALAPTIAAGFILLGGVLVLLRRPEPAPNAVTARNLWYLARLLAVFALGLALMRWTGPAAAALFGDGTEYRLLRDTAPWKYIGFVTGGTAMIAGQIALVEGRVALRGLGFALLAACGLAALFGLPFDDLLLPPNGDV